jgi:hypothetical protein
MTVPDIAGRFPAAPAIALALLGIAAAMTGCDLSSPRGVVVATSWPLAQRDRLQSELRKWQGPAGPGSKHEPIRLEWLVVAPGDDREQLARRLDPPDVLLGGPDSVFERLARLERLIPVDSGNPARWCALAHPAGPPAVFGDPRVDSLSLEWAMKQLDQGHWREGYAQLVELAGKQPRIGGQAGKRPPVRAANDRGVPAVPRAVEGVGILALAREQVRAREFLRFLVETGQAEPAAVPTDDDTAPDAEVESLVADLLGASLVDAQDELWTACSSLDRAGTAQSARNWLTEPPPWPPASIEKYLRREGENAMSLIETLAAELSPLPAARGWLVRSWLSPPRIVDLALLKEMAHLDLGALAREPRFRSWLRAEWTASARQRYRRVSRLAAKTQPGSARSRDER